MNQELEALGRRAVACEHWQWLPGMLAQSELPGLARVYAVQSDGWIRLCGGHPFESPFYTKTLPYPDLSDPATLGALLGLVREAWQDPATGIYRHARRWCVIMGGRCEDFFADTEAEALVCALEAAP